MNRPSAPQQPPPQRPAPENPPPVDTTGSHQPEPVDLSAESVAGEEDPGAGIDMDELVLPPTPAQKPRKP
jgi:hypothetical protein